MLSGTPCCPASTPSAWRNAFLKEAFDLAKWIFLRFGKGDASSLRIFVSPAAQADGADANALKRENRQALEKLAAQEAQMEALLRELDEARRIATTAAKRVDEINALAAAGAATAR